MTWWELPPAPTSFKSFVALISAVPSGMRYWLLFTIFFERGNAKGSHNNSHSTGQGTNVRILPSSIYLNQAFQAWRNSHRMSLGNPWTYCELDFRQNFISHMTSISPYFNWRSTMFYLGEKVSWNQHQFRTSIQQNPEGLIVTFPPRYSFPCKGVIDSSSEGLEKS